MNCDGCGSDLKPSHTLIAWDETDDGVVLKMRFSHKGACDDQRYDCSAGAAYGSDWDPSHERNGVARKPFAKSSDKARLMEVLRAQESALGTNA